VSVTVQFSDTRRWQLLALAVLIGVLVWLLAPVLTPFATAALLAYLGDPLVDRLERFMSRTLAVCVVFATMVLAIVLVVVLLVPMLERQITRFVEQLPAYIAWFRTQGVPWLEARFGMQLDAVLDADRLIGVLQQHWREAGGVAATVVANVSKSGFAVIGWLVNLLMIPVVTFFLLRDWDVLVARVHELIPRGIEPVVSRLARESDEVLGAFLRGQLSVMIALGVVYTVGLWAIGIDLALLIGMTAGLISFVPYLGGIVGVAAALIAALVQYHDVTHVVLVLLVFGVGQTLEGMVLTPLLVGDRIGLHPVAVIFAVLAGGELFGFLGVLLALPAASVVMVLLRHAHARYIASDLYGAPTPPAAAPPDAVAGPAAPPDAVLAPAASTEPSAPPA
jgi:predicted PurR-regulated permease PerM